MAKKITGYVKLRRRIGRPRRHLQFDVTGNFLRHTLLLLVVRILTAGNRLTFHGFTHCHARA
jgi:hypothetical protein